MKLHFRGKVIDIRTPVEGFTYVDRAMDWDPGLASESGHWQEGGHVFLGGYEDDDSGFTIEWPKEIPTMRLEYCAPIYRQECWYITAVPKGKEYRPGYVNSVMLYRSGDGFTVHYTDGYKTQILGFFDDRLSALAAMVDAIRYGAGCGFTSRFKPNEGFEDATIVVDEG